MSEIATALNVSVNSVTGPHRQLDAGSLPFVWIDRVAPADSIHLLQGIATDRSHRLKDDAIFFISVHQSPETMPTLVQLAAPSNDLDIREKAAFWLANQHGHDGFLAIQRMAREDVDPSFREKLTFDLTLCHDPAAVDELIRVAKEDQSPQVRRQAQFWMAQKGGEKVVPGYAMLRRTIPIKRPGSRRYSPYRACLARRRPRN